MNKGWWRNWGWGLKEREEMWSKKRGGRGNLVDANEWGRAKSQGIRKKKDFQRNVFQLSNTCIYRVP